MNIPITSTRARTVRWWWIPATFLIAMCLQVVPLPESWTIWRPNWVGLFLIYWCVYAPRRVGIFTGWLSGLALDVMQFTLLGQQALAKCLIAFIASRFANDIRTMAIPHQLGCVFILLVFDVVIVSIIQAVFLQSVADWRAGASALTSVLLWPLITRAFGVVGRRHDIY